MRLRASSTWALLCTYILVLPASNAAVAGQPRGSDEPYYTDTEFEIALPKRDYSAEIAKIPRECWFQSNDGTSHPDFHAKAFVKLTSGRREVGTGGFNPLDRGTLTLKNTVSGMSAAWGGDILVPLELKLKDLPQGTYPLIIELQSYTNDQRKSCNIPITQFAFSIVKRSSAKGTANRKPPSTKPAPAASEIVLPGRSIRATANTVTGTNAGFALATADLNRSIRNLKASVDAGGSVCFAFDFADTTSQFWGGVGISLPLLVRLFDENGQYLTHIRTRETFAPAWKLSQVSPDALRLLSARALQDRGNRFCYSVNRLLKKAGVCVAEGA